MAVASAGTVIVVGGGGLDDGGVVEVEPEGAVAGFAAAEGGGADGAVEGSGGRSPSLTWLHLGALQSASVKSCGLPPSIRAICSEP